MELRQAICEELKIPWQYLSAHNKTKALCLVHENWLQMLIRSRVIPLEFIRHEWMDDAECELLLQHPDCQVKKPWRVLEIRAIRKRSGVLTRLRKYQILRKSAHKDITYSQFLHYISDANYKNLWKNAYNHCIADNDEQKDIGMKEKPFSVVAREALQRLYSNCPFFSVQFRGHADKDIGSKDAEIHLDRYPAVHPNILPAVCILESARFFYVIHPHVQHSAHECVTFSPAILGSSNAKPLFLVYQLLNAVRDLHDLGLCFGDVNLDNIRIDSNLWLQVQPKMWQDREDDADESNAAGNMSAERKRSVTSGTLYEPIEELHRIPLNDLVGMWMRGQVTNLDYLMVLNHLAGRRAGNPTYHPVLPWVVDFRVPDGGWRDLSKSKFRLNKGDRQLDLTYESLPNTAVASSSVPPFSSASSLALAASGDVFHVPHHVSDVLSEITYYVYKARQTPKSVLCRYVRSNWVPAEYPSSMQRLYEWTPDECIPEYFVDPSIFRSVHEDLPNLLIPWWASSPEDFITKHRQLLEGPHVSERLHHWIDLTFGYKLSGTAAVKSKNVCLHLVDQHTELTSGGVVQLFSYPHPHRLGSSPYLGPHPPSIHNRERRRGRDIGQEKATGDAAVTPSQEPSEGESDYLSKFIERRRGSSLRSKTAAIDFKSPEQRAENHPILLPKDFQPLLRLHQLEALYNFTAKATCRLPRQGHRPEDARGCRTTHQSRRTRDMCTVGCLVVEIFLASKLRSLPVSATLEAKCQLIRNFLNNDSFELPRCVRQAVRLLLHWKASDSRRDGSLTEPPPITDDGLPPPSAHQLLQPLVHIVPFPPYFGRLYAFLCRIQEHKDRIAAAEESGMHPSSVRESDVIAASKPGPVDASGPRSPQHWAEAQVKMTAAVLPELLPLLGEEGLGLLAPYLKEMFENRYTAILSAWYLFDMVGQAMGPAQTTRNLLEPLTRLFDADFPTAKHMKLFHRTYLLQLIVRFGLQTFLAYFTTLLIEAVGGFKDFRGDLTMPDNREYGEGHRKGSHLRSPELESLAQESESRDVEGTPSPFDENSSQTEIAIPFKRKLENVVSGTGDGGDGGVSPEQDAGTEPEIFVFDATGDDFMEEFPERMDEPYAADLLDQLDQKYGGENSSDSTSGDALSIGEVTLEGGHSPVTTGGTVDDDPGAGCDLPGSANRLVALTDGRNSNSTSSSFSEGFPIRGLVESKLRTTQLADAEVYSSSVPNLPSDFLSSGRKGTFREQQPPSSDCFGWRMAVAAAAPAEKSGGGGRLHPDYNVCDVATESILWLSHRLGPVLTAKYLSRNLLRMLSLCYLGEEQVSRVSPKSTAAEQFKLDLTITLSQRPLVGDKSAQRVFECLTSIASLYGEQFIMLQYIPHMVEIVLQSKRRVTPNCESGLVGNLALLHHVVPYLSDATLMDHLQDTILKEILHPTVRLISSRRLSFPSGGRARQAMAYKFLDALYLIGLRIGFEMTRKHLTTVLQRFFAAFSRVHWAAVQEETEKQESLTPTSRIKVSPQSVKGNEQAAPSGALPSVPIGRLKASWDSMSPPISEGDASSTQSTAQQELAETFTPELAYTAYISFCKLAGSIHMERHLSNDDLIRDLCLIHDQAVNATASVQPSDDVPTASGQFTTSGPSTGSQPPPPVVYTAPFQSADSAALQSRNNVALIGNRIDLRVEEGDEENGQMVPAGANPLPTSPVGGWEQSPIRMNAEYPKCDASKLISKQMDNDHRHLRGNWFAYWEHEIGESLGPLLQVSFLLQYYHPVVFPTVGRSEKDHRFNFKQIKLQTFVGHSSSIRTIQVLDNENSFISASKDKTVKLWSLRSHGDGFAHSACQWTYTNHKKSVFSVTFLESLRLAASCDSTVHVWDPFMGACIRQFDSTKNSPVTVLLAMPAPSTVMVNATTEASVRFMDVRTLRYMHEYKVSLGPAGLIRCLAVSPNGLWIAVGHSSGIISILDVRTGLMSSTWKGHEGEVLQIRAFNNNTFVTSSLDQSVTVWNADDGKQRFHLRGPTEPVHCFNFYRNEMISGTTANRIGVHTSVDNQASFSSTRLRSDTFKGVLTCLTVLPLNRLLLLGADNGSIRLLC